MITKVNIELIFPKIHVSFFHNTYKDVGSMFGSQLLDSSPPEGDILKATYKCLGFQFLCSAFLRNEWLTNHTTHHNIMNEPDIKRPLKFKLSANDSENVSTSYGQSVNELI